MFFDPLPARYSTIQLKQRGVKGTSTREHPVFRDPCNSPGHEITARMAVCIPASASTKEDERTGDGGDVGSEMDKKMSIR